MKNLFKHRDVLSVLIIFLSVFVFFYPFFLQNKLPIPADTVIGLYNPFRDLYAENYPNGVPYKNFLLTDPVRQQYVWKQLAMEMYKEGTLPIWNPYEMSGKPLLANFQSGVFYPLNLLLFISPFFVSWSLFIILQLFLAGLFMYLYLKNLKLSFSSRILGSLTWIFSGFFIAWLEWGNIVHTVLWLPLLLLSVHKLLESKTRKVEFTWFFVLILASCSSFFAGHLQSFFYIFIFIVPYIFSLWYMKGRNIKKLFPLLTYFVIFITLTSIQWVPTLQFIDLSGRVLDVSYNNEGWFIPYQNLAQFLSPDFFGNPATLNYYGVFNYGEFIGYTGLLSIILSLYAIIFRRDRKTIFFTAIFFLTLLLATKNLISIVPFILKIPFVSTAQPTRLLFLTCFSLSMLTAFGLDYFEKKKRRIYIPVLITGALLSILWGVTIFWKDMFPTVGAISVTQSNLKLPTVLYVLFSGLLLAYSKMKSKHVKVVMLVVLITVSIFDLLRFGWKYTPFVDKNYVFPETKITSFLKQDNSLFRIVSQDAQIMPPNFTTAYGISSIEGYDPLYLNNYASVIAANDRSDHSISQPFGFNRIITPRNVNTNVMDFLNVKYVLSFNELNDDRFKKVLEEGKTKLYENKNVLPRVFFVENVKGVKDRSTIAINLFKSDLSKIAYVQDPEEKSKNYSQGSATIVEYRPNKIVIMSKNSGNGFLVMSEVNYPSFRASIDNKDVEIKEVNNAFRGIEVPAGSHVITLTGGLF